MSLVEQTQVLKRFERTSWQGRCFTQLAERLTPPSEFPCIFSQNAFGRGLLLFSFVDDGSPHGLARAAEDLSSYVELSRDWDGKVSTARPLVVAFSRDVASAQDVAGYHDIGWRILQGWHEIDRTPWPDGVATDPHSPFWTMCFNGMQLFVNMSNPAHVRRRSRNLGDSLLFIVNPRERFDIVAGDTPEGRRVRQRIRDRIERYDGIGHSPQLGSYAAGEIEWWQYGVIEENRERTDRCPFLHKKAVA
ncbi:YqcI/YcgG family protein [Bradyrhizobium sp. U87765 SZCCT0131]|uniref:YqcI/YcgG family protein n=1 Tax=unclassified Bradyrhizobium TaxID=2631580 RepID=UPI001BAB6460|nr:MULTISPECIES: YqcI/YcgG family protein [unclassified Bradyrhizobium]MBR1221530.1 YqcI/YcgG family protein [Bradyrhizobium sp. U87765 SZCCT0131]MBR1264547.1 YqcI/YcgG family protein [Bradyrhizobium sp. U87765 SZCCT0134]MBR1304546.1 YqcI/YcgG family protein [Bradyrhizobium sp. U87765 SZCCT0110]MBR1322597.1 YqcI/YcgG family protein [Bradyrhizobium sp. U87765 SZCCT0109]MBR1346475.1 YqcI/YcgG family protein [Bradyrhizobium sp. U87765 SZCCT0048]